MKIILVLFLSALASSSYARSITITTPVTETIVPGTVTTVSVGGQVDSVAGGAGVVKCNGVTATFLSGTTWRRAIQIPSSGPITISCIYTKDGLSASQSIIIYHDGSNVRPTADFSYSIPTNTSTINLDASLSADSDGYIVSYVWNYGDGSSSTGLTSSHTYSQSGTYRVYLQVIDNGGNVRGTSRTITVTNPGVIRNFYTQRTSNPSEVNFDASDFKNLGTSLNYLWDFGDGQIHSGLETSVNHLYASLGDFSVNLKVLNGSTVLAEKTQILNLLPLGGFSASTITPKSTETICLDFDEDIFNDISQNATIDNQETVVMALTPNLLCTTFLDLNPGPHYLSIKKNQQEFVLNFDISDLDSLNADEVLDDAMEEANELINDPDSNENFRIKLTDAVNIFEMNRTQLSSGEKLILANIFENSILSKIYKRKKKQLSYIGSGQYVHDDSDLKEAIKTYVSGKYLEATQFVRSNICKNMGAVASQACLAGGSILEISGKLDSVFYMRRGWREMLDAKIIVSILDSSIQSSWTSTEPQTVNPRGKFRKVRPGDKIKSHMTAGWEGLSKLFKTISTQEALENAFPNDMVMPPLEANQSVPDSTETFESDIYVDDLDWIINKGDPWTFMSTNHSSSQTNLTVTCPQSSEFILTALYTAANSLDDEQQPTIKRVWPANTCLRP